MGRDKAYLEFEGETLIQRAISRLEPQVQVIGLSTGPNRSRLSEIDLPRVFDLEPSEGPVCGILAGLAWARASGGMSARLVTVPIDCPHIPFDLVRKLHTAGEGVVFASSGGRHHPVVSPSSLAGRRLSGRPTPKTLSTTLTRRKNSRP
jgi:molybdopterin-guanine dinucleotide biosynthesis protein A